MTSPHLQDSQRLAYANADKAISALTAAGYTIVGLADGEPVKLTYTNWRGETSERTITPKTVYFGSTEWHPEPQWLLRAFDHDKRAERDFALKDFGTAASPHMPVPAGWVLVPEEPTGDMLDAAGGTGARALKRRIWRDMLASRPKGGA